MAPSARWGRNETGADVATGTCGAVDGAAWLPRGTAAACYHSTRAAPSPSTARHSHAYLRQPAKMTLQRTKPAALSSWHCHPRRFVCPSGIDVVGGLSDGPDPPGHTRTKCLPEMDPRLACAWRSGF